jgi:hypothetical protein
MLAIQSMLGVIIALFSFGIATMLGLLVYHHNEGVSRYLGFAILYPWLAILLLLIQVGAFADLSLVPPPMGIAISTPPIVALILLRMSWFQRLVNTIPTRWLIGIQTYRLIGAVFLLTLLDNSLPREMALPTGILDITIGATALWVARQYERGNRTPAWLWNIVGLSDFAYSITLTLLAAPTAFQILNLGSDFTLLGQAPLAIISGFGVPVSIILHVLVLLRLFQETRNIRLAFKPG